jgi:multidrug efflux pump subunit AcrB
MVDIDQTKLLSKGLTPLQVVNAVNAQNLTLPGGDAKIGKTDYTVRTNSMPPTIEALNDIPVSYENGARGGRRPPVRDADHAPCRAVPFCNAAQRQ